MDDRDGKKTFTIPKTHPTSKDVLIPEKVNSRNVAELFTDLKSCALEYHFNFRQNQCQSCDLIRNVKLQKNYNERRIQIKKEQEFSERLAFHLISSRDCALDIATNGLQCDRLSFPIDKYLGNPKDGVHLSRRPDVLLASTGYQGLYKFGLLVCKVLLGKGYPTMPSIDNKQFSSQLHYDHHFSKIQFEKKDRKSIQDLLANSLIFCYEHNDLETINQPSQILPLAILWYDLKEKFPIELTPKLMRKAFQPDESPPTKYPTQFLIPISSLCSPTRSNQKTISNETVPLSPSNTLSNQTKSPLVTIPLDSKQQLTDPRLKSLKQTISICYLDASKVQHALQQQKRLKSYFNSSLKTIYTLIPFHFHSIRSPLKSPSSLIVSVTDCFTFGLKLSDDRLCIDLEDQQNQIAFEQIQFANQLDEQQQNLRLNEKKIALHERKLHDQNEHSKNYVQKGRKFLKDYETKTDTINCLSNDLIEFFVKEYRQETRVHIKRILAELMGVFLEKYPPTVVDMDIEELSTQGLNDHDERFRVPTPPPINTIEPLPIAQVEPEDIPIEQDLNQSRDEFVKLLTKEACLSTTNDEIEKNLASTRTVIIVSNKNENSLIIETPNIEHKTDSEESINKRIKIDSISPIKSNEEIQIDELDTHHDFDERRRETDPPPNRFERSYSQRTFSQQQHSRSPSIRHQRFNYNHQSIVERSRASQFDQKYPSNSTGHFYQDNYHSKIPALMETSPFMSFANSKPSNSIEQLQMFLDNPSITNQNFKPPWS